MSEGSLHDFVGESCTLLLFPNNGQEDRQVRLAISFGIEGCLDLDVEKVVKLVFRLFERIEQSGRRGIGSFDDLGFRFGPLWKVFDITDQREGRSLSQAGRLIAGQKKLEVRARIEDQARDVVLIEPCLGHVEHDESGQMNKFQLITGCVPV